MVTDLALARADLPTPADWNTMLQMGDVLVKSGMLPAHIKTGAAAVAIIQRGRELGIPAMYALNNIVYIQGKATANSELMLALIYRDHGDDAIMFARSDHEYCKILYKRRGWTRYEETAYTLDDAKRAGLLSNQTWQKYPAAMLRARAISAVARMAFPDTIGGLYTPEELGASVEMDREGGFVVIENEQPESLKATDGIPAPMPTIRYVTMDGEIISAHTVDQDDPAADIARIINDANSLSVARDKGTLRLLGQEAERKGLLADPEVEAALRAAKARVLGQEGVTEQPIQPTLA